MNTSNYIKMSNCNNYVQRSNTVLLLVTCILLNVFLPWHSGRSPHTEMLCSIWPEQCPTFPGPSVTDSILRLLVLVAVRGPQLALHAVQPLHELQEQASLFVWKLWKTRFIYSLIFLLVSNELYLNPVILSIPHFIKKQNESDNHLGKGEQ